MVKQDVEMSLGDHLVELRTRIIRGLLGVLVATVVAGIFYREIMKALLDPYLRAWDWALQMSGMSEDVARRP